MDASDNQGEGKGSSKRNTKSKESDDYKKRRERNNIAVRKSRQLSRQKAKVTEEKVTILRSENKSLEQKVKLLTKELGVLKDLFLSTAAPPTGEQSSVIVSTQEADILQELQSVETDHKYSISE